MDEIENEGRRPRPRAVAGDGEESHPGLERLLAYRDGELSEMEADDVQEHLSLCSDCALLLLEFDQFRADAEAGERGTSDERRAGAWAALQAELRRERAEMPTLALPAPSIPAVPPVLPFQPAARRPLTSSTRALFALAAVLALVAIGLSLALVWSQDRYRAELQALEESRRETEELRARLAEARNRAPGTPLVPDGSSTPAPPEGLLPDSPPSPRDGRLAGAPKPPTLSAPPGRTGAERPEPPPADRQMASAIAVAVGPWLTTRGENASPTRLQGGGAVNPLTPGSDGRILLGFDPGTALEREKAKLTLLDAGGRTLWTGERLSVVLQGDLGTAAALTGLAPGRYRLRLEAVGGGGVVEYLLEVTAPQEG